MSAPEIASHPHRHDHGLRQGSGRAWSVAAGLIAALVLLPVGTVIWLALNPSENIWPHLMATVMPRYLMNTAILAAGTGMLAAAMGAGAAWLVSLYDFPGRRLLEWALLLPLAVPAYIGAYALADFLDYSGPVQMALRGWFGWASARDYWFPQVRSLEAAILVMAAANFPYVYLLTRAALHEQSGGAYEVARALGTGGWGLFRRVGLPLARPAIVAGSAIAMMEAVADYGVVSYFGVQTLNTGIFTTWLERRNAGGAAQIACVILLVVMILALWERFGRRNARYSPSARQPRPILRQPLRGPAAAGASIACFIPFALGFILPVGVILNYALAYPQGWITPGLARAAWHTITLGATASVLTVLLALVMVYGVRLSGRALPRLLMPVTTIGYAAPGAVLAVGILFPLAALDHRLADGWLALTGTDPGLILTGSGAAIVLAYLVRFFAIAQGAIDGGFTRVPPSLPMAARSLGRDAGGVLRDLFLPLMKGSVGSALLLVFVDSGKELPATLLLRPFNYETLATRAHEKASLEDLGNAAPAALLVMAVGLLAVALLARANLGLRKPAARGIAGDGPV
ncbi:MAG: ABC transporter permease [Paracoccus sp. (in: a-proteobacteria)]|uniref:ABC transporter permease n=1 Tax=unclassified Paracoccus (in: a-proteobacteria) TaxID=2688777 RepID=UPI000C655830|nr:MULTISPECIES: iron ABC transporter permease [unclassified Paracoccus (in: a-proteobacteria)]MAN55838.1 iron ABC transporter permease [Paracoccus sp. (in: a-proteobacteria)]MBA49885.1 iron ABC transporter permease [Paracoccus sp. (in: a-proteobacteria)]MCS5601111.1 iron ABC transporter permease [Paracoccus sp. (in: a-proteobacteria)]MDB2551067.1 iron ABC transporter permease [Paracoccus sp. (in: a-proteobacteria)]|tara:strand:+ start:2539 stop:4257 length:1719 start_codon:yes stop_codon:yes gene_type:complete